MKALCVECKRVKKIGWLWEGSKFGYGDYKLECDECGKVIHEYSEEK